MSRSGSGTRIRAKQSQRDVLRAGVARVDITPTKPVTLAGYGSRKDVSRGVHDPLSARAIAFEQGGQRLVLVSADILGFYGGTAARFREAILAACWLKPSELFLSAIHTHSAPTMTYDLKQGHRNNVEYTKRLEAQLAGLVRKALIRMAPVEIGIGSGSAPVGANRREVVEDPAGGPRICLGRNPDVMTDREVQVLTVSRAGTGRLAAAVFAYATHSTSMGPGNYLVSGDIHGLAEQFLERYLGGKTAAVALAGASGNIDPWFRVLPKFVARRGWIPESVLLATMLGEEVVRVLAGIRNQVAGGPVRTAFKTLELPGKPRGKGREAPPVEFSITAGRIGDVGLVGLGGEVFNEIGRAIKAASPFPHTLVMTHCNGAAGYLPTPESYPKGGYEVETSAFAPTAAKRVIREAVRMLKGL